MIDAFRYNFCLFIFRECPLTTKTLFESTVRTFQIPHFKPLNAGPATTSWSYKTLPQDFIVKICIMCCHALLVLV